MSYQMAILIANREGHSALMTVLALPKLRGPLGRILANSGELICNPILDCKACERSIHAPLEFTKRKTNKEVEFERFQSAGTPYD